MKVLTGNRSRRLRGERVQQLRASFFSWSSSALVAPILAYFPLMISSASGQTADKIPFEQQSIDNVASVTPATRSPSSNPTKQKCAVAYETAQEHRASGALTDTRSELEICAQAQCPSFVQQDCKRWLTEVENELPSFTIVPVNAAGQPAIDAVVELDGRRLSAKLLEHPIAVDPGQHQLVVKGANNIVSSRQLLAHQGIQAREIRVVLSLAPSEEGSDLTIGGADSSSLRPYAYASWGLAAVGLGVFGVLGHMGRTDEHALRDDCKEASTAAAPEFCNEANSEETISDYRTLQTFADIGLYTGLAAIVGGTTLFFLNSEASEPPSSNALSWGVTPLENGAFASVLGRF